MIANTADVLYTRKNQGTHSLGYSAVAGLGGVTFECGKVGLRWRHSQGGSAATLFTYKKTNIHNLHVLFTIGIRRCSITSGVKGGPPSTDIMGLGHRNKQQDASQLEHLRVESLKHR